MSKFKGTTVFKIGDRVKCIGKQFEGDDTEVGKIYHVRGHVSDGWVQFKEIDDAHRRHFNYNEKYFELVKEPEMKFVPMPELKTGMRLKSREGEIYIFIKEANAAYRDIPYWMHLDEHDLNTGKHTFSALDIVEIYDQPTYNGRYLDRDFKGDLIWEYKDPEPVTTEADMLREQLVALKAKLREMGEEE